MGLTLIIYGNVGIFMNIRFVGSINKEIRFREVVNTYNQFWEKKGEKAREEEGCDFCKN